LATAAVISVGSHAVTKTTTEGVWVAAAAGAARSRLRVRRCRRLAAGAACLVVHGGGRASAPAPLEGERHVVELGAILREGSALLGLEETLPGAGPSAPCLELSGRLRGAVGAPQAFGPLVGELCERLRALPAAVEGSEGPAAYLGGRKPGLGSDVPLAGALLACEWWRSQAARALAAPSWPPPAAEESGAEAPRGRGVVLLWLARVLRAGPGRAALGAFCGEGGHETVGTLVGEAELLEEVPPSLAEALRLARPPSGQPRFPSSAERREAARLADARRAAARLDAQLVEAVRRGDLRAAGELLRRGANALARASSRTPRGLPRGTGFSEAGARGARRHEYGLVHLAASLCVSLPRGAGQGHPAHGIAADLGVRAPGHRAGTREGGGRADVGLCRGAAMLHMLEEAGATFDGEDSDGLTPVFYAAMSGSVCCLSHLMNAGGRRLFDHRDLSRRTPLYWAVANDQPQAVEWLLDHAAAEIDAPNSAGQTALAKAAWCDLPCMAELLLARGADPGLVDEHGRNCLHKAAWGPDGGRHGVKFVNGGALGASPRCVQALMMRQGSSSLLVADNFGATPLHVAASTGALDALDELLRSEAGRRHATHALARTAFKNQADCLRRLLSARGDPWWRCSSGHSALDHAVVAGSRQAVGMLLEQLVEARRAPSGSGEGALAAHMASAAEWCCRRGRAGALRQVLGVSAETASQKDFVHLCFAEALEGRMSVGPARWPPFTDEDRSWPEAWLPEQMIFQPDLHAEAADSSECLAAARKCCRELLRTRRARVSEGTLCGILRHGLADNAVDLVQALVDARLASAAVDEAIEASSLLAWPLVAAAAAGDLDATEVLLSRRAHPDAGPNSGLALAVAVSVGSPACAVALAEQAAPDTLCPDVYGQGGHMPPVVLAAAHGQAECVECLLALARRQREGCAAQLGKAAAEAAAAAGRRDIAQWLASEEVALSPSNSWAAELRLPELPKVLQYSVVSIDGHESSTPAGRGSACEVPEAADAVDGLVAAALARTESPTPPSLSPPFARPGPSARSLTSARLSTCARDVVLDGLRLHGALGGVLRGLLADRGSIKVFHAPQIGTTCDGCGKTSGSGSRGCSTRPPRRVSWRRRPRAAPAQGAAAARACRPCAETTSRWTWTRRTSARTGGCGRCRWRCCATRRWTPACCRFSSRKRALSAAGRGGRAARLPRGVRASGGPRGCGAGPADASAARGGPPRARRPPSLRRE
ncbi:unnamed protein product, partial [Prorocentrum cordatum]